MADQPSTHHGERWPLYGLDNVDKLIKECTVFFSKELIFDQSPFLFQCSNCVVDLEQNIFRLGRPSDLTSKRSKVVVPEAWLKDVNKLETESEEDVVRENDPTVMQYHRLCTTY